MSPRTRALAAVIALCLACPWGPAAAAVRSCYPSVDSGPHPARTLSEGQKLALSTWAAKAGVAAGNRQVTWRLAINKSLSCAPGDGNQIVCTAVGMPCVIEQVPTPGTEPILPGKPPSPGPKVIPVPAAPSTGRQI
jgi:hypothetical protein